MTDVLPALLGVALVCATSGPASAAKLLTADQMDAVTAGDTVSVSGSAVGTSADGTATALVRSNNKSPNDEVGTAHVFAKSTGDPGTAGTTTITSASVLAPGGHSESHTVNTPSGNSISQSNGVVH